MPQITNIVASFGDGQVVAEVDYNDANLALTKGRIRNTSLFPAFFEAVLDAGDRFGFTCPANTNRTVNIPNNTYFYSRDEEGNLSLVGITLHSTWPA